MRMRDIELVCEQLDLGPLCRRERGIRVSRNGLHVLFVSRDILFGQCVVIILAFVYESDHKLQLAFG